MNENTWEERMAAKAQERRLEREQLQWGDWLRERMAADPAAYRAEPPDDGMCCDCFEWRRFPAGQEHFGYTWWKVCDIGCEHEHHNNEIAMATI